ncbi:MAG: hypothetical protein IIB40_04310 [Candidatus Marinimicrobia bacterium]|nr:hypothetical protein [Candidatus Neomarinimicrobiota bacterium]MCH7954799.1 hypothetical protein [Candidatus Neomarinimicrobiota bacterium]
MDNLYDLLKIIHVVSFVFMSVPLFNLIVVAERGKMGAGFIYSIDRYTENIIAGGAPRCFVFQATVGITGVLLLVYGPLGFEALWTEWIIATKLVLLFVLIALLSSVHLGIQPKIESLISGLDPDKPLPEEAASLLKPLRARRKKLAAICLFIVLVIIILGVQVYSAYSNLLTLMLIAAAALFARRAYTSGNPHGWV